MKYVALIALLAAIACFVYFILRMRKIIKNHEIGQSTYKVEGKEKKELLLLIGIFGGLLTAAALANFLAKFSEGAKVLEYFAVVLGPAIAGISLAFAIGSFMLFYYKKELDEKQKKFFKYAWMISFIVMILGIWLYTEGIAEHIAYPLVSGFSTQDGWLRGGELGGGLQIKWYGIVIVSGALLCYAITDHMTYQKTKKHGEIDTLFILAFLFGIFGARLWYCLVLEKGNVNIFEMSKGGLAVQGGAILGIAAGVTYMLLFKKHIDVRFMMDVAIPTILLAQVAGRWGNFFNQEVYGSPTSINNLWYLPRIVRYNMDIYKLTYNGVQHIGYSVPLFFIEGTINLAGYFFIRYFLGKVCKFHVGLGYQAAAYLSWYGMVRILLEPLRDTEFEYSQSFFTAIGMFAGGLLLMLGFFILHKKRMNAGLEDYHGDKIKKLENSQEK